MNIGGQARRAVGGRPVGVVRRALAMDEGAVMAQQQFSGVIELDVRDSTPDWAPFVAPTAPQGSPNVLVVLYDDTGLAAWSPYGGRINMPTLDRLAAGGL